MPNTILVYFKLFLNDLFRRRVMNNIKISWMKPNMLISYSLAVITNLLIIITVYLVFVYMAHEWF